MFLSRCDCFRGGCGDGSLNDSSLVLVIVVDFCGLARAGTKLVVRVSIVLGKETRSWSWNGVRFQYRIGGVQLHWNQLPNPTCIGVAVIHELYLSCLRFSNDPRVTLWMGLTGVKSSSDPLYLRSQVLLVVPQKKLERRE